MPNPTDDPTTSTANRPERNILVVIYEFVPEADAQIIRWVNLIHFMAELGQKITVITAEFPQCSKPRDTSLLEMIEHPNIRVVREPLMECDPGRGTILKWLRRAYQKAVELCQETSFDVVLTSCLPIYAHGAGSALRRNGHVPRWIADYGDPWSTSRTLGQGAVKMFVEQIIEREILRPADALTVTTDDAVEAFLPIYQHADKIYNVPMGASYFHLRTDWDQAPRTIAEGEPLTVLYPGSFYPTREPDPLFQALAQVDDVQLHVVGKHYIDMEGRTDQYGVSDRVKLTPYSTQREVVQLQGESDVLLLTSWPVPEQISGKFYEYLVTNKPILYVTHHDRDLASDIMREKGIGTICKHDPAAIADALRDLRDKAREGQLQGHTPQTEYGFDVRAAAYLDVIETVIGG